MIMDFVYIFETLFDGDFVMLKKYNKVKLNKDFNLFKYPINVRKIWYKYFPLLWSKHKEDIKEIYNYDKFLNDLCTDEELQIIPINLLNEEIIDKYTFNRLVDIDYDLLKLIQENKTDDIENYHLSDCIRYDRKVLPTSLNSNNPLIKNKTELYNIEYYIDEKKLDVNLFYKTKGFEKIDIKFIDMWLMKNSNKTFTQDMNNTLMKILPRYIDEKGEIVQQCSRYPLRVKIDSTIWTILINAYGKPIKLNDDDAIIIGSLYSDNPNFKENNEKYYARSCDIKNKSMMYYYMKKLLNYVPNFNKEKFYIDSEQQLNELLQYTNVFKHTAIISDPLIFNIYNIKIYNILTSTFPKIKLKIYKEWFNDKKYENFDYNDKFINDYIQNDNNFENYVKLCNIYKPAYKIIVSHNTEFIDYYFDDLINKDVITKDNFNSYYNELKPKRDSVCGFSWIIKYKEEPPIEIYPSPNFNIHGKNTAGIWGYYVNKLTTPMEMTNMNYYNYMIMNNGNKRNPNNTILYSLFSNSLENKLIFIKADNELLSPAIKRYEIPIEFDKLKPFLHEEIETNNICMFCELNNNDWEKITGGNNKIDVVAFSDNKNIWRERTPLKQIIDYIITSIELKFNVKCN